MIRPAKIIAIVFGALAAVALIALLGINLYLQSGDVQQRIRFATEDAIGAPVTVRSTIYTPWSGLTLSGLSVPAWVQPAPNLFEASKFSVRFELLPLLNRRFVIREVMLDKPVFALRQRDDGTWSTLPPDDMVIKAPTLLVEAPVVVPSPDPGMTKVPATEVEVVDREVRRPPVPYEVELRKLRIQNGSVVLVNNRGRPVVLLRDVRMTTTLDGMDRGTGEFSVASLEFGEALRPKRLRGNFEFSDNQVTISDIECELADGTVSARVNFTGTQDPPPYFKLALTASDVSIPALLVDATGEAVGASGVVQASMKLEGDPTKAESFSGQGRVELENARMRPVDFIRQIGTMFRVDELQMLDLSEAEVNFMIADETVLVERLMLKSDNLMIAAQGPVRFDGKMKLDARLLLNQKLQRQLRAVLSTKNFEPSEDADYRQVTFTVKGRLSRPETDLVERMTGIQLGNFGGLIRGLFQTPRRPSAPSPEE